MSDLDLDELERLEKAATPGPQLFQPVVLSPPRRARNE
jgi:hypothetical protein